VRGASGVRARAPRLRSSMASLWRPSLSSTGECRTRGAGRWNWIPSAVHHRIVPFQGGALTLVFGWMRRDGRWAFFDGAREIPHDSAEGKALIFVK